MSNVVTPRGPLPPRVYWRRRLVMLAVVVVAVLLVGQLFDSGDDTRPTADATPPSASSTASPSEQAEPHAPDRRGRDGDRKAGQGAAERPGRADRRSRRPSRITSELAAPTGPCKASDVMIVPDVEDTDAMSDVPLRLGLSTMQRSACTFEIGSESVALQITSGDDLIWQSATCSRVLDEEQVVVRAGWLSYVTLDWSGRRGSEGCGDNNSFAEPGYYWAEAAAIGGEPQRSQFELETPPPPPTDEPTDEPSEEPTEGASAEPTGKPTESASAEPTETPSDESSQEPSKTQDDEPVRSRHEG